MWNFDKIQPQPALSRIADGCGLMWNFDKIQPPLHCSYRDSRCGLMWNFDKIQQAVLECCIIAAVVYITLLTQEDFKLP